MALHILIRFVPNFEAFPVSYEYPRFEVNICFVLIEFCDATVVHHFEEKCLALKHLFTAVILPGHRTVESEHVIVLRLADGDRRALVVAEKMELSGREFVLCTNVQ